MIYYGLIHATHQCKNRSAELQTNQHLSDAHNNASIIRIIICITLKLTGVFFQYIMMLILLYFYFQKYSKIEVQ